MGAFDCMITLKLIFKSFVFDSMPVFELEKMEIGFSYVVKFM